MALCDNILALAGADDKGLPGVSSRRALQGVRGRLDGGLGLST
jgi:hypothetical protein